MQAKHEHIVGGRFIFRRSRLVYGVHKYGASIADDITIAQGSLRLVDQSGRTVDREPAVATITFRLWLRWTGQNWTVAQKGRVA